MPADGNISHPVFTYMRALYSLGFSALVFGITGGFVEGLGGLGEYNTPTERGGGEFEKCLSEALQLRIRRLANPLPADYATV